MSSVLASSARIMQEKMENDNAAYVGPVTSLSQPMEPGKVMDTYTKWAPRYEEFIWEGKYDAPFNMTTELVSLVPEERRQEVRVLEVGAGTGFIGKQLLKKGFGNIDAIEPAEGMMTILKKTGAYRKTYQELVGYGCTSVPADEYDLVYTSGTVGRNHIPVEGVEELIRVTKPGGQVVMGVCLAFYPGDDFIDTLEDYMKGLEEKGAWCQVVRKLVPNHIIGKEGVIFIYNVL